MMEQVSVYIALRDRAAYVAAGWKVTLIRLKHGGYSALAECIGESEPIYPSLPSRDHAARGE